MTTIQKLISELTNEKLNAVNVKCESFEASHDADLCPYVDYIISSDDITVGVTLVNGEFINKERAEFYANVKQEFESKFSGIHCIIRTDISIEPQANKLYFDMLVFIQANNYVNWLNQNGLTNEESREFLRLLNKIQPSEKESSSFYSELEEPIPFEGGITFHEAIIALKDTL